MALGLIWNFFRKNDLEILPSFLWLLLMVLPFWVQFDSFPSVSIANQMTGIVFIGTCLLVADSIKIKPNSGANKLMPAAEKFFSSYWLYAGLFILITSYHMSLIPHIPLIEKYLHGVTDPTELSRMREDTSKLLNVSSLLKFLFNWAANILAPVSIVLALRKKKYLLAVLFFIMAALYAVMSLAKTQMVFLGIVIILSIFFQMPFKKRLLGYLVLLILMSPFLYQGYDFLTHSPLSVMNWQASQAEIDQLKLSPEDPRSRFTPGDHSRLAPLDLEKRLSASERVYNYTFYRVFLGPADVSSRWYQYFPEHSDGFIGLQGLKSKDRENAAKTHPARLVGHWAYTERFPNRYLETVQAYASVDADAYARFGIFGIVLAGVLVLVLRILLKVFRDGSELGESLYVIALVLMGLWWSSASVQAILLAQGVLPILALLCLRYVFVKIKKFRNREVV
ncbi:hypothetical protein [Bdellovibrio sp. ArHS]|uniref:hypothetical protein n=1 Tax=Bdellovibrio sp. ArHS TaxID=1569284 RepID=UPI0025BA8ADA|nr:hypothetical protein [Bdellovibrio sp. ArHS]